MIFATLTVDQRICLYLLERDKQEVIPPSERSNDLLKRFSHVERCLAAHGWAKTELTMRCISRGNFSAKSQGINLIHQFPDLPSSGPRWFLGQECPFRQAQRPDRGQTGPHSLAKRGLKIKRDLPKRTVDWATVKVWLTKYSLLLPANVPKCKRDKSLILHYFLYFL